MQPNSTYPQYRKYPHERTYFKIISAEEWEELHIFNNKVTIHSFTAKILPDRNYIHDLTFDYKKNWVAIEEEEYEKAKEKI
ncbi:MAG: hypothetical protein ACT4ON_12910 [Bacteroidota bacterium]